jgi:hypothetical protein
MSGGIGCELVLREKRWHGFILSLRDEPPFNPIPGTTYLATIFLSLRDEPPFNPIPGTAYLATIFLSLRDEPPFNPIPGTAYLATIFVLTGRAVLRITLILVHRWPI